MGSTFDRGRAVVNRACSNITPSPSAQRRATPPIMWAPNSTCMGDCDLRVFATLTCSLPLRAVSNPNALQCMRRSGSFAQRAVAVAPAPSQDVVVAPEEPQEGEEEPAPKPRGSRTLSVWDRYDN